MIKKLFSIPTALVLFFIYIVFFMGGCASTGMPSGGPKDEDPPYVVRSNPPDNSLSFSSKEIRIEFNELIQVRDIFQKLMVSPPVNTQPTVTARANVLIVRFEEELQENTTYTLDFADAIADNNEGNVLPEFRFSFSTGDYIDSLQISGFLFDAATLAPVANALVMVHKNIADSAFQTIVPVRVAKTNADGQFSVQNMAEGEYRLFALEDANRNFIYDQPGERIAWHSQLVSPHIGYYERIDSISDDSAVVVKEQAFLPDSINLFIFQEDNTPQYIKDVERKTRNKIDFIFGRPLLKPLEVKLLEQDRTDWFVYESSLKHDSVTLWITDSLFIKSDSLLMTIKYPVLDSLRQISMKQDTLNAYFFETSGGESRKRRRGEPIVKEIPSLKVDGLKGSLEILERLSISFQTPLNVFDKSAIRFFQMQDTIPVPRDFTMEQDSIRIRRFSFDFSREPGGRYLIEADSAAFVDVYGHATNKFVQEFLIKTEDSYGVFYLEVQNPNENWLIQVLNKQDVVVRQAKVPSNGKIAFRYIRPGEYFVRIVDDSNNNNKWDTGDFLKGVNPENLYYYPEIVNVRANWDHMITWNPFEFDIYDFVKRNRKAATPRQR